MADCAATLSDANKKCVNLPFGGKTIKKKVKIGELVNEPTNKYSSLPPGFNLAGRPEQLKHFFFVETSQWN
jgi:hypothetical protein